MKGLIRFKLIYLVIIGLSIFVFHLFLSFRYSPCIDEPLKSFLFKPIFLGPYDILSAEIAIVLGLLIVLSIASTIIFRRNVSNLSFVGVLGFFILLILIAFMINPISVTGYPHAFICPL